MIVLSFVLALGAVAFPVAFGVSAVSRVAIPVVRRLSPVPRAEVAAWLAVAPVLAALALAAAVTVPSVRYGLGLGPDHCLGHGHHAHLCVWHGAALPAWLAAVGALGWAAFVVRAGRVVAHLARAERLGAALAALGAPGRGFHVVPATIAVCHAVGVVRPRVLVSRSVIDTLDDRQLKAVIAHEQAHLDRADPRWSALLALAGAVAPFTGFWAAIWREAAEEAADDHAACVTDGPTVAGALVAVARLRLDDAPGFAFGAGGLERRVRRLLDARAIPRRCRALRGAFVMVAVAAVGVGVAHEPLHHLVEEAWERVVLG